MTSRRRGLAGVAALVACVVSCPDPGASRATSPATHTIEIRGFRFVPAALRVAVGDTVVWVNRDAVPHTATTSGRGFDSGDSAPGARRSVEVRKRGMQPYICAYHPSMKGQLEVR